MNLFTKDADASLRLRLLRRRAECAQQLQDWSMVQSDRTGYRAASAKLRTGGPGPTGSPKKQAIA